MTIFSHLGFTGKADNVPMCDDERNTILRKCDCCKREFDESRMLNDEQGHWFKNESHWDEWDRQQEEERLYDKMEAAIDARSEGE